MSILESKINSIGAIALDTASNLSNNYYTKAEVTTFLTAGNNPDSVSNLFFQYYNKITVDSILTYYITSGSLANYARKTDLPTNFLTSGSLVGYVQQTSPSITGTLTTNFLNISNIF